MGREPMADVCDDGYRIVRHTHDVELARELMRAAEIRQYGCPGGADFGFCADLNNPDCPHLTIRGEGRQVYVRIITTLPGMPADGHFGYIYKECEPKRGAFKAVVFG